MLISFREAVLNSIAVFDDKKHCRKILEPALSQTGGLDLLPA
jgi:hypothetical protein